MISSATREQIFQALFTLVSAAQIGGNPAFLYTSRRFRLWTEVAASEQPALLQMEGKQVASEKVFGLPRWQLYADLYVYARVPPDAQEIPSTQLNNLLDAIETQLVIPGAKQTLGGLVLHCAIDGEVMIDEGVLDQQAVMRIPVRIVTA